MENKKKLIYADDIKNLVNTDINRMYAFRLDGVGPLSRFLDQIDNAPAVDAVPVVYGFWKSKGNKLECSVCSHRAYLGTEDPGIHEEEKKVRNYCFHCGAKMDLEC